MEVDSNDTTTIYNLMKESMITSIPSLKPQPQMQY